MTHYDQLRRHEADQELKEKLKAIALEQEGKAPEYETVTVGGIKATLDKHEAIGLVLDFCGPAIEFWFEQIR